MNASAIFVFGISAFLLILIFGSIIARGIASMGLLARKQSKKIDKDNPEYTPQTRPTHKRDGFPFTLKEFIGQPEISEALKIYTAPQVLGDGILGHTVFYGLPGLGKTTLAELVAVALNKPFISTEGAVFNDVKNLHRIIKELQDNPGAVLFIDEIHQCTGRHAERLYKLMENWYITDVNEEGTTRLEVPKFTLIGATTEFGDLLKPLRDRFKFRFELAPYAVEDMEKILKVLPKDVTLSGKVSQALAKVSQNTPRILRGYLDSLANVTKFEFATEANMNHFRQFLTINGINEDGFSASQMRVIDILCVDPKQRLGLKQLAIAAQVNEEYLQKVVEPALLIGGYMYRTSRGRMATERGIALNKKYKAN